MPADSNASPGAEPRRDNTVAIAHAAISSMLQHGIPPSPPFFEIWFDYHAGTTATVRRLIDTYLSNRRRITEEVMHQIHDRFFTTRREAAALSDTARRLQEATGQVVKLVAEAGGDSARYGNALETFRGELATPGSDLAHLLSSLIAETQRMAERSADLGTRLEASAQTIASLETRLQEALREANTDLLTGLPNRRAIEAMATNLLDGSSPAAGPFSLAILDIDRFKAINDTWGHPVGDAVLRRVAGTLAAAMPAGLSCGRYGGEEFLVLLPGHDLGEAARVVEGLRTAVAAQQFSVRATGGVLGPVTLSAGVALRRPDEAWPELVSRADSALYRAKAEGRNRVVQHTGGNLS